MPSLLRASFLSFPSPRHAHAAGSLNLRLHTCVGHLAATRPGHRLERSFSVGVVGNQVRLYEIDVRAATDILATPALAGARYTPVTKRLVLDFETLKSTLGGIANLEGMTFGPKLANGRESLVVVADDNFPAADSATDRNQILAFEVIP